MFETLRHYYELIKPGRVYANLITLMSGFFFATVLTHSAFSLSLFVSLLLGALLVIASSCVFNNYFDRGIDAKMERTKSRASVVGVVSTKGTLIYAAALGVLGFSTLLLLTNVYATTVIALGFVIYVLFYGIGKRKTAYGTIIGSFAGATPILAGYVAVSASFDINAYLLFLCLALWQMPHFYAIALYRLEDYRSANMPVLPAVVGTRHTRLHIFLYIIAFTATALALTYVETTGITYFIIMLALCVWWFWSGIQKQKLEDTTSWGRSMFRISLVVLMTFSVLLPLGVLLP